MKRAVLLFLIMLSACASARFTPKHYQVDSAYAVRLERAWIDVSRITPGLSRRVHLLTLHGVALEQLYLVGGLQPGTSLTEAQRGEVHPVYHADLTRSELVGFVSDSLAAMGYARTVARNIRPAAFAGANGVRFELEMQTTNGLDMSAVALAAQSGDRLNLILFVAPRERYYSMLLPEVDRMLVAVASP